MSTPTATPRTDAAKIKSGFQAVPNEFLDFARTLETELAAEREKVRVLREALESLAYWSRNNTETRQTLRDRIRVRLDVTKEGSA